MKSETELDHIFEAKDEAEHTRHLSLMLLSGIAIGFICAVGIIFVWLNAELIDRLSVDLQILLIVFLSGGFGILRLIVWLRNLG